MREMIAVVRHQSKQDRIKEIEELISYCEEGDIQLEELYNELDELTMDD